MTDREAIDVLFNEWKCIDRNDGIHCDRKCESCDLVMDVWIIREAFNMAISALQAQELSKNSPKLDKENGDLQPNLQPTCNQPATDTISRQAAIDEFEERKNANGYRNVAVISELNRLEGYIMRLPSAQPEPLTDNEQRIFLAAMGREEKVCEEVDRNYVREPYEDSLVRVCKEIRRKVKGALWI